MNYKQNEELKKNQKNLLKETQEKAKEKELDKYFPSFLFFI